MDERRKWIRVDCRLFCGVEMTPAETAASLESRSAGVTQDISEGGVRMHVFHFIPVGRKIRILLELPSAPPIETLFEIMWINEIPRTEQRYIVGGRFLTLADDHRQILRRFVNSETLRHAA